MASKGDPRPGTAAPAATGYPRAALSAGDLLILMWRAKWLMLLAALPILTVGWFAASQSPMTFQAASRLYVQTASGPASNAAMATELEFLRSSAVAERVVSRFPLQRIAPQLTDHHEGVSTFLRDFSASADTDGSILQLSYRHADSSTAVELLNATVASYLAYREEMTETAPVDGRAGRLKQLELDLLASEDAMRAFLRTQKIADFNSERAATQGVHATLLSELSTVRAEISAVRGQISTTRAQMAETPQTLEDRNTDTRSQALRDLQREREDLLTRYTPESQAVRALDQKIARAEADLNEPFEPLVETRPNPIYQALETTLNAALAKRQSLSQQQSSLTTQITQTEAQLETFAALEPDWIDLVRQRDVLDAAVQALAIEEQLGGAARDGAGDIAVKVRQIGAPEVPAEPFSQRGLILLLTGLFATVSALLVGLLRSFTHRGFPSKNSLNRTMRIPVIEAVRRRR